MSCVGQLSAHPEFSKSTSANSSKIDIKITFHLFDTSMVHTKENAWFKKMLFKINGFISTVTGWTGLDVDLNLAAAGLFG